MNLPDLESEIIDLLNDLSTVQDEMLSLLSKKRDLMAKREHEQMPELEAEEEVLCGRLQACHDRRAGLLQFAQQRGLPSKSLRQLAQRIPTQDGPLLNQRLEESSAKIRLLQHESLTNWVVAQKSLLHISQMLEIIATGGKLQPTYGKEETVHSRGSLVDHEA